MLNGRTEFSIIVQYVCICITRHGRMTTWWRHQIETFSALQAICAGNSLVTGELPTQRASDAELFNVFFGLRLNKRLSKQSWGWWFKTSWRPLWRHCNTRTVCSNMPKVLLWFVLSWSYHQFLVNSRDVLTQIHQGPLLLTCFNFNPSMDK